MAEWTAAKRKKYLEEHPENFAGEDGSYPIEDGNDVKDAWDLAGHAPNSGAVRAKVKSIAKRLGLTSSLPDTATEDDSKERSMGEPSTPAQDALTRAAPGHGPVDDDTTHSHSHDANGSQGGDKTHEHSHFHAKGTASHDHPDDHKDDAAERAADGTINAVAGGFSLSFPIVRQDAKTWSVSGLATAERPDKHGTIFSYEGAKGAFERWPGNIREQHDKTRAVGRRIQYEFDDAQRSVYLEARISKTRPDTWERVMDNTLNDFSVSVIPAEKYGMDPRKWPTKEYNGRMYPYLPEYDYAEISLVDAGSLPGAHFTPIMRADGTAEEVLALLDDEPAAAPADRPLERASKTISAATKSKIHNSIGQSLQAVKSQMQTCADDGCQDCQAALKQMDPDNDGDIDAFGGAFGDTDNDAASLAAGDDMDRAVVAALERVLPQAIERALTPAYSRLQGIAGALARSNPASASTLDALIECTITRALDAAKAANESSLSEVRADLSAVKETVGKIADTPVPGAPVMNGAAAPRPVEKRLATDPDPYQQPRRSGSAVFDAIAQMSANGLLDTTEKQVDALAAGLIAQRQGR